MRAVTDIDGYGHDLGDRIDPRHVIAPVVGDPYVVPVEHHTERKIADRDCGGDRVRARVDLRHRVVFDMATQTLEPSKATPAGASPTGIVAVTAFVVGSIRDTVSSLVFATQTLPPPAAMPLGSLPTGIVAVTLFVVGLILDTVLPKLLVTQMLSPSKTRPPFGPSPTPTVAVTTSVAGLIFDTVSSLEVVDPDAATIEHHPVRVVADSDGAGHRTGHCRHEPTSQQPTPTNSQHEHRQCGITTPNPQCCLLQAPKPTLFVDRSSLTAQRSRRLKPR